MRKGNIKPIMRNDIAFFRTTDGRPYGVVSVGEGLAPPVFTLSNRPSDRAYFR